MARRSGNRSGNTNTNSRNKYSDTMANVFCMKDAQSKHNGLNGEFLLYQVILKRLLTEGLTDPSIQTKLLDHFNPQNEIDIKIMKEFDETYKADKAIYWYTRESCIYRLLNKALRTQNIPDLIAFTKFIRDLFDQLSYEQINFFVANSTSKLKVYRGQLISIDEIGRIKYAKGELISMNSFLSTSTNREKAVEFATTNKPPSDAFTTILLEINLDLKNLTRPYADIKSLSAFAQEDEVLFMFGCIFRIDQIYEDKQMKIWRANLTLCGEEDKDITQLEKTLEKELEGKNMLVCLGEYMMQMQKFDEAQAHYEMLISNELIDNSLDLATCYFGIGQVNEKKGEYEDAIENINVSINYLLDNTKTKNHSLVSQCYNYLGLIYSHKNNEKLSFKYYEKALRIETNDNLITYDGLSKLHLKMKNYQIALEYQFKCLENQPLSISPHIAFTLIEIGKIYGEMNEFNKSINIFENAIKCQKDLLSSDHPDLGYSYISMGLIYLEFNDYSNAFDSIKKAYDIQLKSLPNNHSDFGETFKSFGLFYNKKKDFNKSLEYFNLLLENQLKTFSIKHPNVGNTYLLIGNTYLEEKDYDNALIYFEKLLKNQIERLQIGNSILSETYKIIGNIYFNKIDLNQSLIYYEKLLDNELQTKSLEDSSLSFIYDMIAKIYYEKKDFSQSLIYLNRLLDTQLKDKLFDEKLIEYTYQSIGNIYLITYSLNQNLLYFNSLYKQQFENKSLSDYSIIPNSFQIIEDFHFEQRHLDQVLAYFNQLLEKQLNQFKLGDTSLSNTYKIIISINLQKQNFEQVLKLNYNLLENELKFKTNNDPSLVHIYKVIADRNLKKENFDQSLIYYEKLLKKTTDDLSIIDIYINIAKIYFQKSNFIKSFIYINKSIDLQIKINNLLLEPYLLIGKIFLNYNYFQYNSNSNLNSNNIIPLNDKLLPDSLRITPFIDINSNERRHLDRIQICFQEFLNNSSEHFSLDDLYKILGFISLEKRDFNQTFIYLDQFLHNQSEEKCSLSLIYKIIATIYYEQQNFSQALTYFKEFLNHQIEESLLADIYHIIAIILFIKQDFQQSLIYFNKTLDYLFKKIDFNKKIIIEIYDYIQKIYLQDQNIDFNYFNKKSNSENDSIEDIHFEKRHLDYALNYFNNILKDKLKIVQFGDNLLNDLYKIIANIYLKKFNFDKSLIYFNKLLINQFKNKSLNDLSLSYPYKIIALIYFNKQNYDQSLIFFYRFIDTQLKENIIQYSIINQIYNIIFKIYLNKSFSININKIIINSKDLLINVYQFIKNKHFLNYHQNQSLIYFQKLLIKQTNFKVINQIYLIISNIYLDKNNLQKSLFYLNKTFQKSYSENSLLADIYTILANIYFKKYQLKQSLKYYRIALNIYNQIYPSTHFKIIKIKQNITDLIL